LCAGRPAGPLPRFAYPGRGRNDEQFGLARLEEGRRPRDTAPPGPAPGWPALGQQTTKALTTWHRTELAQILGLHEGVITALAIGYRPEDGQGGCWTFPECDAAGQVVGLQRRYRNGKKRAWPGGRRG